MSTAVRRGAARAALVALLAGLLTLLPVQPASAATVLPDGFTKVDLATGGFQTPTSSTRTPDGRLLVAEKAGRVRLVPAGATAPLSTPLLDITAKVNSPVDRGLLGITVDTDFASNRWVYLLYSAELYPATPDTQQPVVSRLVRYVLGDDNTFVEDKVILGTEDNNQPCPLPADTQDCIPADYRWHVIGTVISDRSDGTLWVGSGDTHALTTPDDTTFRPYMETNAAGKILHVDRDGNGLPGHPFCPGELNLTLTCTKIYAKGFRNPFRFTLRPDGKGLVVGDVGAQAWEEINLVTPGGNYGWPCYEGPAKNPVYSSDATCTALYAQGDAAVRRAAYEYPHGDGASAIAGPEYTGGAYPADWVGDIFIADYAQQFIKRLELTGDTVVAHDFATNAGTPVELKLNAAGELEYTDIFNVGVGSSGVHKFTYTPGNQAPSVSLAATPTSGLAPLSVGFSTTGTSDPDGDPLTYAWDFGDGATGTGTSPAHTYLADGVYVATVTVSDGQGHAVPKSVTINVGDANDPTATITSPTAGSKFVAGQELILTGTGSDVEDGTLTGTALQWQVILVHGTHQHEVATPSGTDARFTPQVDHDADSHYEITLTATDTSGRTDTATRTLLPDTSTVEVDSVPPGVPIVYGEAGPLVTPYSKVSTVGYRPSLVAPERWVDPAGVEWVFESWSDLGARQHDITVPPHPSAAPHGRYVAHYATAGPSSTLTFAPVADTWVDYAAPSSTSGGTSTQLLVDAGTTVPSPQTAYLRFDLSSIGCQRVRSVRLRMTQVQGSPRGGQVHSVASDDWTEATTSYATRPAIDPTVLARFGVVTTPNTYEVALPLGVVESGLVSLAIDSIEYDGARWASRESSTPPQLLVTLDPTTEVSPSAAVEPIPYSGHDRLAVTAGGRLLSVHSPATGGLQLSWAQGDSTGCAWSSTSSGAVSDGRVAPSSRGPLTASLAVATLTSGADVAWVAYAPSQASSPRRQLRVRRLTDLDAAAGPTIGPEVVLDTPAYGAVRPDLAVEMTPDGPRVAVVWVRRMTTRVSDTTTAWLSSTSTDAPTLTSRTTLLRSRSVLRPGVLASTPTGLRALVQRSDGQLRIWKRASTDPLTGWTAAAAGAGSVSVGSSPAARAVTAGLLVAADRSTGAVVTLLDHAVASAATELVLPGHRNPVLAGDGTRTLLLTVRVADGALVSRTRNGDGTWTSPQVELASTSAARPSWPAAVVADGRLHVLVPAERIGLRLRRLSAWRREV